MHLVLLFALCLFSSAAVDPVPLDSGRVVRLGLDPREASRWFAFPAGDSTADWVVFADGVSRLRLDSAAWDSTAAPPAPWVLPLRMDPDRLRELTRPREGLVGGWTFGVSRSARSSMLLRQSLDASIDIPWLDWVSVGLQGGFDRTWTPFPVGPLTPGREGGWTPWWGAQGCLRSVCLESRSSRHPIPRALWLQPTMDSLFGDSADGVMVRRWSSNPSAYYFNMEHALHARFGPVSWDASWDGDTWKGLSQEIAMDPLGTGALRWGLLLGTNASGSWTGMKLAIVPGDILRRRGIGFAVRPFHLVARWASMNEIALELGTDLSFHRAETTP